MVMRGGREVSLAGRALGDFVIRERIGAGGFGIVFRAEQRLLAREAVVKVLATRHSENDVAVQRFLREAQLASKLDHPYAAHIYAFGIEPDGVLWIAMEYVRGTPLDEWLRRRGPFAPRDFSPLLDGLAEVVQTAHERGIVHRDIKPSNIMVLQRAGKLLPKLLDLGIAKLIDASPATVNLRSRNPAMVATLPSVEFSEARTLTADGTAPAVASNDPSLTQAGAFIGSPAYMAPELWDGPSRADSRSDLYALGVLGFEVITGQPPYGGGTLQAFEHAHATEPVPTAGHGAAIDQFFARALAKSRTDRFADALEMARAFRAATGLGDAAAIPKLDAEIRDAFIGDAPAPIAQAVAAIDAAENAHQARDAIVELVGLVARTVAVLALSSHSRSAERDVTVVSDWLRDLRRHELPDPEWIAMAVALCRSRGPLAGDHPLPDLVRWCTEDSGRFGDLWRARSTSSGGGSDKQVRDWLAEHVPAVNGLLASLTFLLENLLVVRTDGVTQVWNGQRTGRRRLRIDLEIGADDRPFLIDASGRPLLRLWPLVQAAAPAPGAETEMFLLDGPGRQGARLRSASGFLVESPEVWEWMSAEMMASASDEVHTAEREHAPYLGLRAFSAEHADRYLGREKEVMECANRLRVASLLCVVGPSGAGKSSFVQAGLLPALPPAWQHIVLRPGPHPAATFAHRAGELSGGEVAVVIVDQLEELFTLCADPDEQRAFASALGDAARSEHRRLVLALRDDFLMRAEALFRSHLPLAPGLHLLHIPERRDLLRILTEPARQVGYQFEDPQLPSEMVDAVADQPGALPMLSFAAAKLWEHRDVHFRRLTRGAYTAMGGVAGALAKHADVVVHGLPVDQQPLVREAFRHLVSAQGTRAIMTRAELLQILGSRGEDVIERLLEARLLTASEASSEDRIEIIHESLVDGWPRLAEWRREDAEGARLRDELRSAARQWHGRNRPAGLLWRDEALAELRAWLARSQPSLTAVESAFAEASSIETARVRRRRRTLIVAVISALTVTVAALLWANARTRDAESESRRQAELARASETRSRGQLIAQLVEHGRQALVEGRAGESFAYLAQAYLDGADPSPTLGFMIARSLEPLRSRVAVLGGHETKLIPDGAQFSRDGKTILTASADGVLNLWDPKTHRSIHSLSGCSRSLTDARLSPAGDTVVAACEDGHARLYSADGSLRHDWRAGASGARTFLKVAYRPDGRRVAVSTTDGHLTLWDVESERPIWDVPSGEAYALAFSPDGRRLATTSFQNQLRVWDAQSGKQLWARASGGYASSVEFSHDGRYLVTPSWERDVNLWDAATGRHIARMTGHGDQVDVARFSPDDSLIASASRDRTVRIWGVAGRALSLTLFTNRAVPVALAFDTTGARLGVAASDGSVYLWDARLGSTLGTFQGHAAAVRSVEFSLRGDLLLTGSDDQSAALWDLRKPAAIVLGEHGGSVNGVSVSPDGRIWTYGDDGVIRTWARGAATPLARLKTGRDINAAALTSDGERLIAGDSNGRLLAWNGASDRAEWTSRPHEQFIFAVATSGPWVAVGGTSHVTVMRTSDGVVAAELAEHRPPVFALAWSPDGTSLLTGDSAGVVRTYRAGDWRPTGNFLAHQGTIRAIAFEPDGDYATVGDDGMIRTYAADGTPRRMWRGHRAGILVLRVDRRGRLLTGGIDGVAHVWNPADGSLVATLTGHANLVTDAVFSPDGELVLTGGDDRTARIWSVETGRQLATLPHANAVWKVLFAGDRAITASADRTAAVWNAGVADYTRDEIAGLQRCLSTYAIKDGVAVAKDPTESGCR